LKRLFINLTPFIPLSLKGEGEGEFLKGRSPFKLPLINDLCFEARVKIERFKYHRAI